MKRSLAALLLAALVCGELTPVMIGQTIPVGRVIPKSEVMYCDGKTCFNNRLVGIEFKPKVDILPISPTEAGSVKTDNGGVSNGIFGVFAVVLALFSIAFMGASVVFIIYQAVKIQYEKRIF